jgi:hypothetical protein
MENFAQWVAHEAAALRWRAGFNSSSWLRTTLTHVVVVGVFGLGLPWQKGVGFLDPVILGVYACLGVVFSAPAASPGFEGETLTQQRALARILVCVLYGEVMAAIILAAGITMVYATHRVYVGPDLVSLGECAIFGLAVSLAVATAVAWVSLRRSPASARGLARLVFLGLLIALFFRSRQLPAVAVPGAAIAAAVWAGALLLLQRAVATRRNV